MYQEASLLAVIPARAGSKGLPNKNVRECAGKPLIAWTISAARDTPFIDDVLVSTDSEEIADVSRRAGASVPFLRPAPLATDDASLLAAIEHAWQRHERPGGGRYEYVVILQPTSPLRSAAHIREAIHCYFANRLTDHDTLASVYELSSKHGWLMERAEDGRYVRFSLDVATGNPQRQGLRNYYLPNGAIFVARGEALGAGLYHRNTLPFVMAAADSVDVDTLDDFREADAALRAR
jgi:CMP-N,N'-diacetyllegionaminic acid synthase